MLPSLLDKRQVARALNLSTRTVDRLRTEGLIRAFRIRGRVRFLAESIQAYIRRQQEARP